jgi:thiol-disulfide isomerase/thioredoxin
MLKIVFISGVLLCSRLLSQAQSAEIINAPDLEKLIAEKSGDIHIINFWATWCAPCVKEIPLFEKLTAEGRPNVKVTLVSLDLDLDPNPEKVYKFVARKKIRSRVVLLDAADPNSWIDKIENTWSGALPATLVINHKTGKRKFIGKAIEEEELDKILAELE